MQKTANKLTFASDPHFCEFELQHPEYACKLEISVVSVCLFLLYSGCRVG